MHRRIPSARTMTNHTKIKSRSASKNHLAPTISTSSSNVLKSFSTLKRWPNPLVESKGDYRDEAYFESFVGGPLYSQQTNLKMLPVPTIKDTLSKFLPTALPLAESKEEALSLEDACRSFPKQAVELQRRLENRKDVDMANSSWLQLWWNTAGYLQVRDPVVVNVSYFFHFSDDCTLPLNDDDGKSLGVKRGASILFSTAEFRKMICSGTLPCEKIGRKEPKTPLCSTAFKYMFNSCRIPRSQHDTYKMYDPSLYKHCVVSVKGHFFAVDFLDENDDALPLPVIENLLQTCVDQAEHDIGVGGAVPKLGFLTSNDRDSWAGHRLELLSLGGRAMEKALEKLESGAILLCLDDEEPISRQQCANIFWTGALTSGENRWFDKSIQIMCTKNGKAGLIGEHSMMDGMPMIRYADFITKNGYAVAKNRSSGESVSAPNSVQNIFKDCIPDVTATNAMVEEAKAKYTDLVSSHSLDVLSFQGYGSDYIKRSGYSPDAYVQIAIQLAMYRLHGKQVGTYEATQMRPFLHGRTETTRSVSPESAAFVKCMGPRPRFDDNDKESRDEKLLLLREAVKSHVKYIVSAGIGEGVDRHFFGLSMLTEEGEELPDLYSHPLFIRSKTWRVSTSHLTHPRFENWGFGEVVKDGVGIGYGVKSGSCMFNVTALKEHGWTDRLCHLLEEALLEMQLLNDMNQSRPSKL